MNAPCPFAEMVERQVVAGLTDDEARELEGHVPTCTSCQAEVERATHMRRMIEGGFRDVEQSMAPRRAESLRAIHEAIRRADMLQERRLRRLNWRFILYATVLASVVMLSVAYLGYIAALQLLRKSRLDCARNEVYALALSVVAYTREGAELPEDGMERIVEALAAAEGGAESERRAYFPFDPARLHDGQYLDPWGRPYVFVAPPPGQPQGFLLYSRGENGVDEGGVRGDDVGLLVINVAGAAPAQGEGDGDGGGDGDGAGG